MIDRQCCPCRDSVGHTVLDHLVQSVPAAARNVVNSIIVTYYARLHPSTARPSRGFAAEKGDKLEAYGTPDADDPHYHSRGSTHVEMLNELDEKHKLPITAKRNGTWCGPYRDRPTCRSPPEPVLPLGQCQAA